MSAIRDYTGTPKRTHSDVEEDTPSPPIINQPRPSSTDSISPGSIKLQELRKNMELTDDLFQVSKEEKLSKLNAELVEKIKSVVNIELENFSSRYTETIESLEREVNVQREQIHKVVQENQCLKTVIEVEREQRKVLQEKVNKIETFSRKDNLIFTGFAEEKNENCEAKIIECLLLSVWENFIHVH